MPKSRQAAALSGPLVDYCAQRPWQRRRESRESKIRESSVDSRQQSERNPAQRNPRADV